MATNGCNGKEKRIFKDKLVIGFTFNGVEYEELINYERDVEIDEGVQWHADGIEADPYNEPYMSVYGLLDENDNPTTESLIVIIEIGTGMERIRDVRVLEIDDEVMNP